MHRKSTYGTLVLFAVVMLLLAGCKGIPVSQTLIPGLTLPPGSKIMPLSEMAQKLHTEQNEARAQMKAQSAATVMGFNYKGDIEAVAAHMEQTLKSLGWKRLKRLYIPGRLNGVIQKVYFAADKKTQLQITDWAQSNIQLNDFEGKARFTVTVIHGYPYNPITGKIYPLDEGDELLEDI
jgi:hypothetical protein